MIKDIAVIVQETPKHQLEIRTGIQGKRGIQGPKGDKGDQGVIGPEGPAGRNINIVETADAVISVNPANHADFYLCTNEVDPVITVVLGSTLVNENGIDVDKKGAAVFFTQVTAVSIEITTADPSITLTVPLDKNPRPYGIGSTFGIISKGNNEWVLFGDLETKPIIVTP